MTYDPSEEGLGLESGNLSWFNEFKLKLYWDLKELNYKTYFVSFSHQRMLSNQNYFFISTYLRVKGMSETEKK